MIGLEHAAHHNGTPEWGRMLMRIHSDKLTGEALRDAAKVARVVMVDSSEHRSRKRARAFNVKLEGSSRRGPNGRSYGADGTGYAATWDQWGVFLAELYAIDPNMVTPYYADADDYATRTADRFGAPEDTMTDTGYVRVFVSYGWPDDAHGDHRFEYAGRAGEQSCRKCSAVTRSTVPTGLAVSR